MYPEHGFALLFIAIAAYLLVRAFRYGVVLMLSGSLGIAAGIFAGWFVYNQLPNLMPSIESFRTQLLISFGVGVAAWLVVRVSVKKLLKILFDPGGLFGKASDGPGGAILSLIPILLTLSIVIIAVRVTGTWAELRRFEKISVPGSEILAKDYPARPRTAEWRDGIEKLPLVAGVFEPIDHFSQIPKRNLVALLITSKKGDLFKHLSEDPETGPIIVSDGFAGLMAEPEIRELINAREHVDLLFNDKISAVSESGELRESLKELKLYRLVDAYMLAPERQRLFESYGTPREPAE